MSRRRYRNSREEQLEGFLLEVEDLFPVVEVERHNRWGQVLTRKWLSVSIRRIEDPTAQQHLSTRELDIRRSPVDNYSLFFILNVAFLALKICTIFRDKLTKII